MLVLILCDCKCSKYGKVKIFHCCFMKIKEEMSYNLLFLSSNKIVNLLLSIIFLKSDSQSEVCPDFLQSIPSWRSIKFLLSSSKLKRKIVSCSLSHLPIEEISSGFCQSSSCYCDFTFFALCHLVAMDWFFFFFEPTLEFFYFPFFSDA